MEVIAVVVIIYGVVLLQNFIFTRYVFHRLDYQCKFSTEEAHEGDHIFLVESIANRKLLPVPWLKVDIHSSKWLEFAKSNSVVAQETRRVTSCFFLKSHQRTVRRWKLQCLKRGVFNTENVTLVSGDLLGFKRHSVAVKVDADLVVYPEIIDFGDLFISARALQGNTLVKRWIIEDPFIVSGAKEYGPMDPLNRIHWQASAKEGKLMVRKNDFTAQMSMSIILNIQSIEFEYGNAIYKDRIELGIKTAATLLDRALKAGIPTRLCINGSPFGSEDKTIMTGEAAGSEHFRNLLGILARLELKGEMNFEHMVQEVTPEIEGSEVFIISAYVNEGIYEAAHALETKGNHVKVILLDQYSDSLEAYSELDIFFLSREDYGDD